MRPLVIVGAGGFGRETVDVVRAINKAGPSAEWDLVGVIDDAPSDVNLERLARMHVPYLGTVDDLTSRTGPAAVAVGVGNPVARAKVTARLDRMNSRYATLVHPTAVIGGDVKLGEGAIICAGASVGSNVALGRHVHLNPHAVIGHDSVLGDFVSVNPNATVSGDCCVGALVLLGAASVVLQGRQVGARSVVGAAACVVRDIGTEQTVVGVPATPLQAKERA